MIIRPAGQPDVAQMADLLSELFTIEADFAIDRPAQIRGLNLLLENPERGLIYVAEQDGRVVGMCSLQYVISTAEGGPAGLLEDMVVASRYRQAGIGRQLLDRIMQHARDHGLSRVQLLADRDNTAALRFYERAGFRGTRLIALRRCGSDDFSSRET